MSLTKENIQKILMTLLRIVVSSLLIGICVSLLKMGAYYIIGFLNEVFIEHNKTKMIIFFCAIIFIIALSVYLSDFTRKDKTYLEDIVYSFILSLCSFFSFASFCFFSPSIHISELIHKQINVLFNVNKDETEEEVPLIKHAVFSTLLVSPISGICSYLEEEEKYSVSKVLKALLFILVSFAITYLLFNKPLITFYINDYIDLTMYYISIPLILLIICFNFVISNIYLKAKEYIENIVEKYKHTLYLKLSLITIFIVCITLAFFFGKYMSFDLYVIDNIDLKSSFVFILWILAFRVFLILFSTFTNYKGGHFMSELLIGAIIGLLITNLLNSIMPTLDIAHTVYQDVESLIDVTRYTPEIILLSIVCFHTFISKKCFTSISLIFAFTKFSSWKNLILITSIICALSYLIIYLTKKFTKENNNEIDK